MLLHRVPEIIADVPDLIPPGPVEPIQKVQRQLARVLRLMRKSEQRARPYSAISAETTDSTWKGEPSGLRRQQSAIAPHFELMSAEIGGTDRHRVSQ